MQDEEFEELEALSTVSLEHLAWVDTVILVWELKELQEVTGRPGKQRSGQLPVGGGQTGQHATVRVMPCHGTVRHCTVVVRPYVA